MLWWGCGAARCATAGRSVGHMPGESMANALFKMASGLVVSFEALLAESPISPQPWFQIQCAGGEIVLDGSFDGGITVYDREHPTGYKPAEPQGWGTSYLRQMEAFLQLVSDATPGVAHTDSAEAAMGELRAIKALLRSSDSGAWEKLVTAK